MPRVVTRSLLALLGESPPHLAERNNPPNRRRENHSPDRCLPPGRTFRLVRWPLAIHAHTQAGAEQQGLPWPGEWPRNGGAAVRTLVIIPTYNERANLESLIRAVLATDPGIDILVVDDSSPDGTGALAEALAKETGRVRVLHRAGKQGLGTAYLAGFRFGLGHGYDRLVEMDADFSHRPEDLPRLLRAAETADVVVGSRNVPGGQVEGWSWLRQLISRGGSLYARLLLGLSVQDCTSGFKCFRREALARLSLDQVRSNGYAFQVEMNYLCQQAGLRIVEVPIVFPDRAAGRSKMSWRIVLEAALLVWRLRQQSRQARLGSSVWRPGADELATLEATTSSGAEATRSWRRF